MAPFIPNEIVAYVVLGLVVLYRLPTWGQHILGFLRDLQRFRDGR
jgi:hypothetical protein